jgi:hypothetical protein
MRIESGKVGRTEKLFNIPGIRENNVVNASGKGERFKAGNGFISIPSCHVTNNYNCTLKQSVWWLRFL